MLLPAIVTLLTVAVAECLLSSKAAKNYLRGKESRIKEVIEENEKIVEKKKVEAEPLDILVRSAILAVNNDDDIDNQYQNDLYTGQAREHPLFPIPEWADTKPCRSNLELWVSLSTDFIAEMLNC